MDMFVLYPVIAGISLLSMYFAVRIVYFRGDRSEKKRKQKG